MNSTNNWQQIIHNAGFIIFFNIKFKRLEKVNKETNAKINDPQTETDLNLIKNKLHDNLIYMRQISDTFPRPNG